MIVNLVVFFNQSNYKISSLELVDMETEELLMTYEALLAQKDIEAREYERLNNG